MSTRSRGTVPQRITVGVSLSALGSGAAYRSRGERGVQHSWCSSIRARGNAYLFHGAPIS